MFNFDTTIHTSDLFIIAGVIIALFKVLIGQRDFNTKVLETFGKTSVSKFDRKGVLGDVQTLQESDEQHEDRLNAVEGNISMLGFKRGHQ